MVTPAVKENAEGYSCTRVEVEDFTGAGELTSFTQRSEQTLISPQPEEERSESSSSVADGAEDSVAPVSRLWQLSNPECVASPLASRRTRRELELLVECWWSWRELQRWRNLQKEIHSRWFRGKDCHPPRSSTPDFQIPERYGSDCSSCSDDSFDRCYSDGRSVDSEWSSIIYDDAHDYTYSISFLTITLISRTPFRGRL